MHLRFMENSTLLTWSMMRTKALWNELFIIHSFSVAEFFFLKHIFYSFEKVCNAIYYFYCKKNSIRKEFILTPSILFSSLKVIGKEWSYKPLAACGWFLRWPGFFFFSYFYFVVIWQEVWNYFHVHKYAWGEMELWELIWLLWSQRSS